MIFVICWRLVTSSIVSAGSDNIQVFYFMLTFSSFRKFVGCCIYDHQIVYQNVLVASGSYVLANLENILKIHRDLEEVIILCYLCNTKDSQVKCVALTIRESGKHSPNSLSLGGNIFFLYYRCIISDN